MLEQGDDLLATDGRAVRADRPAGVICPAARPLRHVAARDPVGVAMDEIADGVAGRHASSIG